jgi:serine/threonine protein kinase
MIEIDQLMASNRLFDGHYKLLQPLSTEGGTADVWLAIDVNTIDVASDDEEDRGMEGENTGMLVAIKIYRPKNALDVEGEQRFRDEFKIVYECRHENLLQPTNFSIFEGIPYLVLPYCKSGSSEQLIGKGLTSEEIWKFILDVSSGLNRLHTNEPPIIHQDIKPANILIDNSNDYAITDFGISSKRGGTHGYYYEDENSGTMAYMAPERFLENAEPMSQSDIWAFGATLYEILTGNVPFGEEGGQNQAGQNMPMPQLSNVSTDIQRLIYACLSKEPANRPSASQIREAALAKQFPVKKQKGLYIGFRVGFIAVLIIGIIVLLNQPKSQPIPNPVPTIPIAKVYSKALSQLDSEVSDTVKRGLIAMDSLSNLNYVPAVYQMALTYGWYNNSTSLHRKHLLGIEVYGKNEEAAYLPKLDKYNNDAVSLLSKIIALNDSNYIDLTAQAAYRLACYYVNPNPIYRTDEKKGKKLLHQSQVFATQCKDSTLLTLIDAALSTFE